jgi:hypothetical protein
MACMPVVRFTAISTARQMVVLAIAAVSLQGAVFGEAQRTRAGAASGEHKFTAIQLWSGFDVVKSKGRIGARVNQYRLGMAAPISADGYCLTAGHVVETEPVATLHLQGSPELPLSFERTTRDGMIHFFCGKADRAQAQKPGELRLSGVRVVYRFENADLALVKVGFPTPRHFRAVDFPGPNDAFVVRANSCERNPSSWWMETDHAHQRAVRDASGRFWIGELSIPATEGDSGSPVFNRSGILHGVLIEKYVPPVWSLFANRRQTIVRYQGVSGSMLDRIIKADRIQERTNDTGDRAMRRPF